MNIHLDDDNILNVMRDSTIATFEFGSKIYGLENSDSDIDDIAIVAHNDFFANTFLWEHHTLQSVSEERDTIFTNMQLLVRNLMTGDSTCYFETLHTNQCAGTVLEFLSDRREWFYNFATIRAFLGYARRDIKHAKDNGKRFSHALRCYYSAKMLFEDHYYTNYLYDYDKSAYSLVKALKNDTHNMSNRDLGVEIKKVRDDIDSLRKQVSESFNSNNRRYYRYMTPEKLKEIDKFVIDFNKNNWYDIEQNVQIDKLYEVLEYGVIYE